MRAALILLASALLASAEVADSSANGFTVRVSVDIAKSPDEVYRTLIRNVGDWWNSAHTFSGDSHNLTIDENPMGCFCEKLSHGGVRHMEVVRADAAKTLVMIGALGPLQSMAISGSLSVVLSPLNGGTKLDVIYAVGGYDPGAFKQLAPAVNSVITEQFTRLKNYAERGTP